jgi:hypothetical protein
VVYSCWNSVRCIPVFSDSLVLFHGDNTGSNPVGDAKLKQQLTQTFARRSKVQKATFPCLFCTLATRLFRYAVPMISQSLSASGHGANRESTAV